MAEKKLKIDQLILDLRNPRIREAANQHEAMQQIIDEQDHKLANLAEHIVDNNSLNPMDRLLVLKKDPDGKYVVLEGNRRALALKLLSNPAALSGLQVRSALQRRFEALAARFDKTNVEPLACYEVETRAEGTTWIELRHKGEDEGRGIVGWSTEAISRFKGRDPALQALDFVRQHSALTENQKKSLAEKFPLSTLDRLLSTPAVRARIGVEIKDDKLLTALTADEAIKPLKRIVLDLAEKNINVTQLKSVKQQSDYIASIAPVDMPDLSQKAQDLRPIETIDQSQFVPTAPAPPPPRPIRAQKIAARTVVVPKSCRLNVINNNTLEIYREKLAQFPNAIAVLLRVFMENSVDHYLDANKIPLKVNLPNSSRDVYKSLEAKVREAIAHMVENGAERKNFDGVTRALSVANHPPARLRPQSLCHAQRAGPRRCVG